MYVRLQCYCTVFASFFGLVGAPVAFAQNSSTTELEEILVVSQRQPYRGTTPLKELPQNIEIFSDELLNEIGITRLDQALTLSSSIAKQNTFGGLWDSFAIRGFAGDENVPSGYLVNGFNGARGFSGPRDSSNIERIEILKGPGSALFGRSEPGGTVNLVTKKPLFETEGSIGVSVGSHETYRVEGDYTGPINDRVAFRINGAYEDADSFRDELFFEKYTISPSILARISDSTTLSYELELVDQESPFDRGVVSVNNQLGVVPISRFLGEPGDGPIEIEATGHQLVLQHDFSDSWSVLAGLSYRESSFKGFSSDPELGDFRQTIIIDGENLARQRRQRDFESEDLAYRIELAGEFNTGPLVHHFLVGADGSQFELDQVQNRIRGAAADSMPSLLESNGINIFNPVYGNLPTPEPFTNTLEEQDAWGVYLQDQIDLSDRWKVTLGVRFDDFSQDITNRIAATKSDQSQTETSPRVGIVFVANEMLSLYASYSEGFRSNTGSDVNGKAFEPEATESYEIGAKLSLADEKITGTIAFYQMDKNSIIVADTLNPGFSQAAGEAESKGVEIDVTGSLNDNLDLIFSYAYIDAEFTNDVADFNFGRFISAGSPLINIPDHTANLTLLQDFHFKDALFSLAGTISYVDDRLGETGVPEFVLPDYTLVNVSATYAPIEKIRISLDVNNLFDEEYYASSFARLWVAPGSDRTFALRLEYSL